MGTLRYLGTVVALCLVLSACGGGSKGDGSNTDNNGLINDDPNTDNETTVFLSYQVPCQSLFQRLCLKTGGNELFYDPIEGFEFVWGHSYELSLKVTMIEFPPADGSSVEYKLEEVISDSEDSIGTTYEYERVDLLELTFTEESGVYYFLGQPFSCKASVDCDGLIAINNSGGSVNLIFEYIGNGELSLAQWN